MKKTCCLVGIIMGVIMAISGLFLLFGFADAHMGSSLRDRSFGGDFYTYEHEATVDAANSVKNLGVAVEKLSRMIGLFNIGFGGAVACFFVNKMIGNNSGVLIAPITEKNGSSPEELPDL